jgi:hypothetical protein
MKKNFNLNSKMCFLLLLVMPFIGISQKKNVISTNRVFPKVDKVLEFEKALANHAQKYHTGDVKWRVFDIQSGPDAGGYHIVEGPKSWESEDSRGDISVAHNTDWHKGVTPFLTDKSSTGYSVYIDSLSTVAMGDYSDKVQIQHLYPKPGCGAKVISMIDNLKEVWAADGYTVAVYSASSSGPTQYAIATRYKQGLKERAAGFRKSFIGTYEKKFGSGSWAIFNDNIREYTDGNWSELISFRADLSSK